MRETTEVVTTRLLAQGLLVRADLLEKLDAHFTIGQLRELARERKVPDTLRRKDVLLAGLIEVDPLGMMDLAPPGEFLQCTDYGRHQLEIYLAGSSATATLLEIGFSATSATVFTWLLTEVRLPETLRNVIQELLAQIGEPAANAHHSPETGERDQFFTSVDSTLVLDWCYVPAGNFPMGSIKPDRDADEAEKPQHRVYVPAFFLAKVPITNGQYQVFVQATGYQPPVQWLGAKPPPDSTDHPVTGVTWLDALVFCHWISEISGIPIRLLTEAEWEKAARGDRGFRYPWGNGWRPEHSNSENPDGGITPVDAYPNGASPYGAYDMAGNVWEWTNTLFRPYPYKFDDGRETEAISGSRVIRGGAYDSKRAWIRPAFRAYHSDDGWDSCLGFRVCCSAALSLVSTR